MGKIMIVDDAMFMREVIRGILTQGGYTDVIEAEDGESALALYGQEAPALTILDITMPGLDGMEVLRRLKALDANARVVMCTAIGQERQMMGCIRLGASDYVVKPFKPENLLRTVQKALA